MTKWVQILDEWAEKGNVMGEERYLIQNYLHLAVNLAKKQQK